MNYRGAVVFSDNPALKISNAVAVSAIILPHPNTDHLHDTLKQIHLSSCRSKSLLLLHDMAREDVVGVLETLCNEGAPLEQILQGTRMEFQGITEFQQYVYNVTQTIPHGETRTYAWLALKMKRQHCERAVGRALGTNPFPLVVPCHRVIKKDGTLGGFMGDEGADSWRVQLKRALLDSEEKHRQPSLFA